MHSLHPVSPLGIFLGKRDVGVHQADVDSLTNFINKELTKHFDSNPNLSMSVWIDLSNSELKINTIVEVMYVFRKEGWDVSWDSTKMELRVGIF
ncbi:hypothetical protein C4565_00730 [Candidatus Parcubacteria bacterium]|nr:MAG: hypothetical protein C4565_00730 [Candidatus Parcubacteria bacterium]